MKKIQRLRDSFRFDLFTSRSLTFEDNLKHRYYFDGHWLFFTVISHIRMHIPTVQLARCISQQQKSQYLINKYCHTINSVSTIIIYV